MSKLLVVKGEQCLVIPTRDITAGGMFPVSDKEGNLVVMALDKTLPMGEIDNTCIDYCVISTT